MPFYPTLSARYFTDYSPACQTNQEIKKKAGVSDDYAYRMYLQHNGSTIRMRNISSSTSITKKLDNV